MRWMPLFFVVGCSSSPCDPGDLASGTAAATVDGAPWSATAATWTMSGSAIQINTSGEGWAITLVARTDASGATADARIGDGGTYDLLDGGFATIYPPSGLSFRSSSGTLTLEPSEGDALLGCFDLTADGDDGTVVVSGGAVHATPL
jgi:hypothetical protein